MPGYPIAQSGFTNHAAGLPLGEGVVVQSELLQPNGGQGMVHVMEATVASDVGAVCPELPELPGLYLDITESGMLVQALELRWQGSAVGVGVSGMYGWLAERCLW